MLTRFSIAVPAMSARLSDDRSEASRIAYVAARNCARHNHMLCAVRAGAGSAHACICAHEFYTCVPLCHPYVASQREAAQGGNYKASEA